VLTQELYRQRQHLEQLQERGKRVPTHAELYQHEEEERNLLRQYYMALIVEQDLAKRKRENEPPQMEIGY
jgi:hypothetical protein